MENIPTFYQGSSIALLFHVRDLTTESRINLAQYDAEATLYTRLLGNKIRFSTSDPVRLPLERREDGALLADIPSESTARLSTGTCKFQLILKHKITGSKLITSAKLFTLKQTV